MRARTLIVGALISSGVVLAAPQTAGAAISATTSGGTFTVNLTGNSDVRLECSGAGGGNVGVTDVTRWLFDRAGSGVAANFTVHSCGGSRGFDRVPFLASACAEEPRKRKATHGVGMGQCLDWGCIRFCGCC